MICLGSEHEKSSSRLDGSTIFTKSTFSKHDRKAIDFEAIFGCQNHENSIKNRIKKHIYFHDGILGVFFRFWLHFGKLWGPRPFPKFIKNRPRHSKNRFWAASWTHLLLKVGFGRVLEGFWVRFGRILEGFWEDFWKGFGRMLEG